MVPDEEQEQEKPQMNKKLVNWKIQNPKPNKNHKIRQQSISGR